MCVCVQGRWSVAGDLACLLRGDGESIRLGLSTWFSPKRGVLLGVCLTDSLQLVFSVFENPDLKNPVRLLFYGAKGKMKLKHKENHREENQHIYNPNLWKPPV